MTRRQPHARPGAPRFTWPAEVAAPPRLTEQPRDPWGGVLFRDQTGAIHGDLHHASGWAWDVNGRALSADHIALTARVFQGGTVLPQFEDFGLTADLASEAHNAARWHFALLKDAGVWSGRIEGNGWALVIQATPMRAGALVLRGTVEAMRG